MFFCFIFNPAYTMKFTVVTINLTVLILEIEKKAQKKLFFCSFDPFTDHGIVFARTIVICVRKETGIKKTEYNAMKKCAQVENNTFSTGRKTETACWILLEFFFLVLMALFQIVYVCFVLLTIFTLDINACAQHGFEQIHTYAFRKSNTNIILYEMYDTSKESIMIMD